MNKDSAVNRFSRCCGMVRDGDYLTRSAIFSSAVSACAAALWGWLAAVLTGDALIVFAGSGCLAAASVFLLVWGSLGDEDCAWILFAIVWLATQATPIAMFAFPLPFLYDGAAVTAGMISSTSHVRRAIAWSAAIAEAVLLPTVRGGAIAAMGAAMLARVALALVIPAVAARCLAPYNRACAERAARSPGLRAAAAAAAARRGLVTRSGRIVAADVFEFDPAGPQKGWQWILEGGVPCGSFAVRPFDEYRRLGSAAATLHDGEDPPPAPGFWCGAWLGWA